MNTSERIQLITGVTLTDKQITVKLEQDVDQLQFMTLNIYTKDAYQDFNSDYGVLVGRVIANGGIGIPNAKISIFIPLDDTDAQDGEISSIYPYVTPRDKNAQGKRYNLLPRVSQYVPSEGIYKPNQPFGSFPIKPEIVANQDFLDVYKKYYKYTALTNSAGDYMIFGVPIGTQTIHMSVDITDIGKYSMTPAAMVVNLGYSPNLFYDNATKIKPSNDLNDLPNIETQEITVDIVPFWGDITNFIIGITRQDFRIRSVLTNTFTIFGTVFTDAYQAMWGRASNPDKTEVARLYQMASENGLTDWMNMGIGGKITGIVTEKIYYYPTNITDTQIATGNFVDQMLLLDPSQYSIYKRNGDFALILTCNRRKIITNDFGQEVVVSDDSPDGIFTRFAGFMTLQLTGDALPLDWQSHGDHLYYKPIRQILKFPQYAIAGQTFINPTLYKALCPSSSGNDIDVPQNNAWRKEHYSFTGGGLYSVSKFHAIVANCGYTTAHYGDPNGFIHDDTINMACCKDANFNAGLIFTNDTNLTTGNTSAQMCSNTTVASGVGACCLQAFGANWLNMAVYLPQNGWVDNNYAYIYCWRVNSQFTYADQNQNRNSYYQQPNCQLIAGKYTDTCSFARSDLNWTDFIPMTKQDVVKMNEITTKGFKTADDGKTINVLGYALEGTYRNGVYHPACNCAATPFCGGKCNGTCTCGTADCRTYFFKGIDTSDCVAFITCLGII